MAPASPRLRLPTTSDFAEIPKNPMSLRSKKWIGEEALRRVFDDATYGRYCPAHRGVLWYGSTAALWTNRWPPGILLA